MVFFLFREVKTPFLASLKLGKIEKFEIAICVQVKWKKID
jgi:hypothetical protein